jgi:hypothetical protein
VFSLQILIGGEFRIIPEHHVYLAEKKVYYVFRFLKVGQCKLKQKETILKLGNALKSKSKFTKSNIGLYTEPTGGLLTLGQTVSPSIILNSPPIKICSENTEFNSIYFNDLRGTLTLDLKVK